MKSLGLLLSALLSSSLATASILKVESSDQKLENLLLAKSATLQMEGKSTPLVALGSGLRQKKVIFVHVKVYVAELFAAAGTNFVRTESEALNSLDQANTSAIRLTFLRSVDAEKVEGSFKEALSANKVDIKDPAIESFLKAVHASGEAHEGKSLLLAIQKNSDGSETLVFEDTNEKVEKINGTKGLGKNILSIWLGQSVDDGIAKLKESLLKGN